MPSTQAQVGSLSFPTGTVFGVVPTQYTIRLTPFEDRDGAPALPWLYPNSVWVHIYIPHHKREQTVTRKKEKPSTHKNRKIRNQILCVTSLLSHPVDVWTDRRRSHRHCQPANILLAPSNLTVCSVTEVRELLKNS